MAKLLCAAVVLGVCLFASVVVCLQGSPRLPRTHVFLSSKRARQFLTDVSVRNQDRSKKNLNGWEELIFIRNAKNGKRDKRYNELDGWLDMANDQKSGKRDKRYNELDGWLDMGNKQRSDKRDKRYNELQGWLDMANVQKSNKRDKRYNELQGWLDMANNQKANKRDKRYNELQGWLDMQDNQMTTSSPSETRNTPIQSLLMDHTTFITGTFDSDIADGLLHHTTSHPDYRDFHAVEDIKDNNSNLEKSENEQLKSHSDNTHMQIDPDFIHPGQLMRSGYAQTKSINDIPENDQHLDKQETYKETGVQGRFSHIEDELSLAKQRQAHTNRLENKLSNPHIFNKVLNHVASDRKVDRKTLLHSIIDSIKNW